MADLGTILINYPTIVSTERTAAPIAGSTEGGLPLDLQDLPAATSGVSVSNIMYGPVFGSSTIPNEGETRDLTQTFNPGTDTWTWFYSGTSTIPVRVSAGNNTFKLRVEKSYLGENLKVHVNTIEGLVVSQSFEDTTDDADHFFSFTIVALSAGTVDATFVYLVPSTSDKLNYEIRLSGDLEITDTSISLVNKYEGTLELSGVVSEEGTPVARTVRIYRRDNGELVREFTSSGVDGTFSELISYDQEVYLIALDDDIGTDYNAIVKDRIVAS